MKDTLAQRMLPKKRIRLRGGDPALLRDCARMLAEGFLLSGASLHGQVLPFAACLAAAQTSGLRAIAAAVGAVAGYLLRWGAAETAEMIALACMALAAAALFQGTSLPRLRWFYPVLTAAVCAVLSGVSLFGQARMLPLWCAKWLSAGLACAAFRLALRGGRTAKLVLAALTAAGASTLIPRVDLGLVCAVCLCAATCEPLSAAAMGMALDCFGAANHATLALLLPAVLAERLPQGRSGLLSGLFFAVLPNAALLLFGEASVTAALAVCSGAALGTLARWRGWFSRDMGGETGDGALTRLENAAQTLELLRSRLPRSGAVPSVSEAESVYDGAAERVCRCCARFHRCWEHRAEETYDALTGAARRIIERGTATVEDFPQEFRENCCHMEGFVTAINAELEGMLFRRRYRMEVQESRQVMAQELESLASYLRAARTQTPPKSAAEVSFLPEVGICSVGKDGSRVSGDRGACFRGTRGDYYVLLCDGMGTGAEASRMSAETVHLLERLLRVGLEPQDALQIYNGAEILRGAERFTTIDLLRIDLYCGEAELYKWGAAPSYWRDAREAKKIGTAAPPPGVGVGGVNTPERYRLSLKRGEMLVLVSDGAGGAQTEAAIAAYSGESARELAALLISGLLAQDDMTAVAVMLRPCSS